MSTTGQGGTIPSASSDGGTGVPQGGGNSFLPWHLIPSFRPGETDIVDYGRRLEFLAGMWPSEHLSQLAPRAALLCEGSAFQKVIRLKAEKLKVNDDSGIKLLVQTLGGVWGKVNLETRYEKFEKAIYGTTQRMDESNESYLARHEIVFEDLVSQGATLQDVRSYILLRNSILASEDKKRVVVESGGNLQYDQVVSSLRLLGSRFFGEVQGQSKGAARTKTYDVNVMTDQEWETSNVDESILFSTEGGESVDYMIDQLAAEGDEDAMIIEQFETNLIDVLQNDEEMTVLMSAYADARRRLSEKSKSRGFWPVKPQFKGGFKGKGKGKFRARKPLAQRIAESECRICFKKGHWKAECPERHRNAATAGAPSKSQPINTLMTSDETSDVLIIEEFENEDHQDVHEDILYRREKPVSQVECFVCSVGNGRDNTKHNGYSYNMSARKYPNGVQGYSSRGTNWGNRFRTCLTRIIDDRRSELICHASKTPLSMSESGETSREIEHVPTGAEKPEDVKETTTDSVISQDVLFASHGTLAVVDLGASQTVMGFQQKEEFLKNLPLEVSSRTYETPVSMSFRFGNNSTVQCEIALMVPIGPVWIRIAIVPSQTPFLLSNNVFCQLGAIIDTNQNTVFFERINRTVPLELSPRKLFLIDVCALANIAQGARFIKRGKINGETSQPVLHSTIVERCVSSAVVPEEKQCKKDVIETKISSETDTPFSSTIIVESQQQSISEDRERVPTVRPSSGSCDVCSNAFGPCQSFRSSEEGGTIRGVSSGLESNELRPDSAHEDCIRGGQTGAGISSCGSHGSEVLQLVSEDMGRISKASAQGVQPLPETLHGTDGDDARSVIHEELNIECTKSQGQSQEPRTGSQDSTRSSGDPIGRTTSRDIRCGDGLGSSVHGESSRERGDEPHQGEIGPDGDHDATSCDCPPAIASETDSRTVDQHAVTLKDHDILLGENEIPRDNWVAKEMWKYMETRGFMKRSREYQSSSKSDLLEIYCSSESELTQQCQKAGMVAYRFGLKQGDLTHANGRCRLYDHLMIFRPRDVWMSPSCRAWCKWSQFNLMRSIETAKKIIHAREDDEVHMMLCAAVLEFQQWRSQSCHFHMEQPGGSEMLYQPELADIYEKLIWSRCDQCVAGNLIHPTTGKHIKKSMQILTTSKIMACTVDKLKCQGNHDHSVIEGSTKVGKQKCSVSSITELYTATFAKRVCRAMQASKITVEKQHAMSLPVCHAREEVGDGEHDSKRRRLEVKQARPRSFEPEPSSLPEPVGIPADTPSKPVIDEVMNDALKTAPRVGKMIIEEGNLFHQFELLFPDKQVRVIELCKGFDRYRKPPINLMPGEAPLRRSIGLDRDKLTMFDNQAWECWENRSIRSLCAKSTAARLMVTIFAKDRDEPGMSDKHEKSQSADSRKRPGEEIEGNVEKKQHQSNAFPNMEQLLEEPRVSVDKSSIGTEVNRRGKPEVLHGSRFLKLPKDSQNLIRKIHTNLGHPGVKKMRIALETQGVDQAILDALEDFHCSTCHEMQKPRAAKPSHLPDIREFNDCVGCDGVKWTSASGKRFFFYHYIDAATNFHLANHTHRTDAEGAFESLRSTWLQWAGPCKELVIDGDTAVCSEQFSNLAQSMNIRLRVVAAYAHWQLGKTERHGEILQEMLRKYDHEHPIQNSEEFMKALTQCCNAKNALSRHRGYTPEILVLGKSIQIPGVNSTDQIDASHFLAENQTPEGLAFRESLARRESARRAFVAADHDDRLRRAMLRKHRPFRGHYVRGTPIMFWRCGNGQLPGKWVGPALVISQEGDSIVWLSHVGKLFRVAPEHVRILSERESEGFDKNPEQLPSQVGKGIFHYQDLVNQENGEPPIVQVPPDIQNALPPISGTSSGEPNSVEAEPAQEPSIPSIPSNYSPTIAPSDNQGNHEDQVSENNIAPEDIPIPDDDELFMEDYWIVKDKHLIRRHVKPRITSFRPTDPDDCPINLLSLLDERKSVGHNDKGKQWSRMDDWVNCVEEWKTETPWTGATIFIIMEEHDQSTFVVEQEETILKVEPNQCWEIEIFLTEHDEAILKSDNTEDHWGLIATAAKRQRAEVKLRNLTIKEQDEFKNAQGKEIDQWLDTGTVRRICRSKIPEQNIMQCRWIHTWKELDAIEKAELGKSRKAKSRIVVLGYQDPNIEDIPRDSPTMHKETRSLLLQLCASRNWCIRSFDVKTAFLRGSKRDTRTLGIEPLPEMRDRMKLHKNEICELLKSAYGLVNAPYLWYEELKESLCNLGFVICPLDPCLFVLPDSQQGIHGIIGMHVDDGLCAGDKVFDQVLQKLEAKFPFGSKREKEFTFTGIQIKQDGDGRIHLNQKDYVENIDPICINRDRRKKDSMLINDEERQGMRGLIGSLQYAATNTRPDIAARLSFLQSKITCATIKDIHDCNRLLADAKKYSHVEIIISPIAEKDVRFVTYSDASFATREKQQSQKGCMVLIAHKDITAKKEAIASPISWHSKKD